MDSLSLSLSLNYRHIYWFETIAMIKMLALIFIVTQSLMILRCLLELEHWTGRDGSLIL